MSLKLFIIGLYCGFIVCNSDFDKIVDDFWEWRLKNNPAFASNVGDQRYTDQLEDYSLEAFEGRKNDMDLFLERLSAIKPETLSVPERISYAVLKDTIQTWVDGYKWKNYGPMNPISFLEGIQTSYGNAAGQVKFENATSFIKFATRIRGFGIQIEQIIKRMEVAIREKTTLSLESVEKVPAGLMDIWEKYNNNVTAFAMYEPFTDKLNGLVTDENQKSEIRETATTNVQFLLRKIKELADFMENTYKPNTRATFGVGGLPRGEEYYQACLKWQLSVDLTADEIHEAGIREVNRVYKELQKIVERANFQGTVEEYNNHLRKNDSLFIADGDEAIQKFQELYDQRIKPKLDRMFKDIPDVPLVIKPMTYDGPNGIYKNGAPDGSRPGVFYANVMSKVPTFDMAALMLHETDPGHHLQDSYALTAEGIPMFRKATDFSKYFAVPLHFPFYTAYSEGWGLYSEDLGEELDIFENDLERFGKFGLEIFRAARLVVDTGIHAKGWSRDKAIEYMRNYTAYTPEFIAREIDRYSTWPAQATSYMIGKLKIRELRDMAAGSLCKYFDIKQFHSILLSNGAMPLSVVEDLVNEWIKHVRGRQNDVDQGCLNQIVDEFWEWRMKNNPEFASNIGDHRYTDKVEDYSLEAFEMRKNDMDMFLKRLGYVKRDQLASSDAVTFDVLKDTIQTWVDGYKWRFYGPMNPVNILEGIQTNYGSRAGQVRFEKEDDFRMFAKRIRSYGVQIGQIITRMDKAVNMRTTNHNVSIAKVPALMENMRAMYVNNETAFPMYEPFKDKMDDLVSNATTKTTIRDVAVTNIKFLLEQVKQLAAFIKNTYIPNTRSSFGVGGLPQGAEYYKACLKWQLSIDLSTDEIHRMGIREVQRVHSEIQKIMKRANFKGTVKEYNEHLRKNDSLFITDGDVALQMFKDYYNKTIVPKLDTMFENIPDFPLKIEKMTYNGPNGIYKNGAPDGSRPGIFLANVNSKVPKFDMAALLLHETDPGHHLQDSYALTAQGIPLFRKVTDFSKYFGVPLHFPFYTAYSEGWGLYSEDLGEDMEIYKDDMDKFGKYGLEIFRAARLVVDTGIHAKDWPRERAIQYMKTYTAYTPEFIEREIDRYSTWPAQSTTYMIGKLKIRELRDNAKERLCNFEKDELIKPFHSVILSNGAMPLSVLQDEIKNWIEMEAVKNARAGTCKETSGADSFNNVHSVLLFTCTLIGLLCRNHV
ncbi:uncharacterized protein LOC132722711 isoform X1 [Ruditapes philippinarum]|uniref:uncharacterized protein LOC132722711 isoform X1 n=1 Tax=Ruditapes philippinarum TaxID=129788 RepID=UPI00295A98DD|nr:uncharacterized protein LOC132722711 isoform X1 [Ruditapes philippinarum]